MLINKHTMATAPTAIAIAFLNPLSWRNSMAKKHPAINSIVNGCEISFTTGLVVSTLKSTAIIVIAHNERANPKFFQEQRIKKL